jgi:hypothetical protein
MRKDLNNTLFEPEPTQWGLRGDPYLWQEMKIHFADKPMPPSVDDLVSYLELAFETITEKPITTESPFRVERFSHGGMSSGGISPQFWRDTLIPMLVGRYNERDTDR